MSNYRLRENNRALDVGWSAKLIVEFEPVAECGRETFWARVESVTKNGDSVKYLGLVENYLTYTTSHGLTMGFSLEFSPENVCDIRAPGEKRPE